MPSSDRGPAVLIGTGAPRVDHGHLRALHIVPSPRRRSATLAPDDDARFAEVVELIEAARHRAYQAVNVELLSLY